MMSAWLVCLFVVLFFFFNDTATTEIYTLSLHDALPICRPDDCASRTWHVARRPARGRSEEHTSELQSHSFISYAVFCLKKKKNKFHIKANKRITLNAPTEENM